MSPEDIADEIEREWYRAPRPSPYRSVSARTVIENRLAALSEVDIEVVLPVSDVRELLAHLDLCE